MPDCPVCEEKMTETVSYNAKTKQQTYSWFCMNCRTATKRKKKKNNKVEEILQLIKDVAENPQIPEEDVRRHIEDILKGVK